MPHSLTAALADFKRILLNQHEIIEPLEHFAPSIFNFTGDAEKPLPRRALMVYIPYAFDPQTPPAEHANIPKAQIIAQALTTRGYSVDVVHWSNAATELHPPYDLIVCASSANTALIQRIATLAPIIYIAPAQHVTVQRRAFSQRVRRVYFRKRRALTRQVRHERSPDFPGAVAVIAVGNHATAETYRHTGLPVFPMDNIALSYPPPDLNDKAFREARRHFLWMGSSPMLLKGLDLVLEAFAAMPDLHLWVCGPLQAEIEQALCQTYARELHDTPNIHALGWVSTFRPEFSELANRCAYLIYPSASEGQSGAVLNCMAHGIVPIVSRASGIDTDDFGITLADTRVNTIRHAAREMAALPPERIAALAQNAHRTATERYTPENFRARMDQILDQVLPQTTIR